MSSDGLRLIRDAAHHRSISKAAQLSGISQSAASQQIQERERALGVELFDRSTRPLSLTPAGKVFVDYCREVLRRRDEMLASIELLKRQANGIVRLAAIYSVGLSEMAEIETAFAARFPQGELRVAYLRPEKVYEAVAEDEADIGLVSYAESTRDVVALPWRLEEMVVAVAPTHPLAQLRAVTADRLNGQVFIGFDQDLPIQAQIERYFREHKVSVHTSLRFDNVQMIKEAVAHGAGLCIMPRRVLREELEQKRLAVLNLNPAELFRPVGIIHRRRKVFNAVAGGLLKLLLDKEETPVPQIAAVAETTP